MQLTTWSPWIAATVLIAWKLGVSMIESHTAPESLAPPTKSIATLPTELGVWAGSDVELDGRLFDKLGAIEALNRQYKSIAQPPVRIHCAFWEENGWTPHRPQNCYKGAGWTLVNEYSLPLKSHPRRIVNICTFEKSGEQVKVLYWYQLGSEVFTDTEGARSARRAHWGRREWPMTFKAMIQGGPESDDQLVELADRVFEWSRQLWPSKK